MKSYFNEKINSALSDILSKFLEGGMDSTARIHKDSLKILEIENYFDNGAKKIRKAFKIPELNWDDDVYEYDISEKEVGAGSRWIDGNLSDKRKVAFQKAVDKMISEYRVSSSFRTWLVTYILYNETRFKPKYNFIALLELLQNNPESLNKVRLTTEEKHLLKKYFRDQIINFKGTGRLPKESSKKYKKLLDLLNSDLNKNKSRRLKNIDIGSQSIKLEKKHIKSDEGDNYFQKDIDLVGSIWSDTEDISEKADKKRVHILRKARERMKKRILQIKK